MTSRPKISPNEPDPKIAKVLLDIAPALRDQLADVECVFALFAFHTSDTEAALALITNVVDEEYLAEVLTEWIRVRSSDDEAKEFDSLVKS